MSFGRFCRECLEIFITWGFGSEDLGVGGVEDLVDGICCSVDIPSCRETLFSKLEIRLAVRSFL